MFARLAFWYGMSYQDVCHTPLPAISAYMERLPAMQAELSLMLSSAASVPWAGGEGQRMVRGWQRLAAGRGTDPLYSAGAGHMQPARIAMLPTMGIGVRHV